jgi:hypothetical protein
VTPLALVALLVFTTANTAALLYLIRYVTRYRLDIGRIAGVMAADLLENNQIAELSETAIRTFVRERYATMCALFGLPSAPADEIADRVYAYVVAALGDRPRRWAGEGVALYE